MKRIIKKILNEESQLEMGTKVEMEHLSVYEFFKKHFDEHNVKMPISEEGLAKMIAKDHIKEDPKYYSKLKTIHTEQEEKDSFQWMRDVDTTSPYNTFRNALHQNTSYDEDIFNFVMKGVKTLGDVSEFAEIVSDAYDELWDDAREEGYDSGFYDGELECEECDCSDSYDEGYDAGQDTCPDCDEYGEEEYERGYEEGQNDCE